MTAAGLRPGRLVVVLGTGTEVGKTWVSVAALRSWRAAGATVAARKPAQSFAPDDATTDAAELAGATGEDPTTVCPTHRWYEVPMAPPMAADVLGRPPFTIADLAAELSWGGPTDVGLVETAGGVRSPLAGDGDALDLVQAIAPDDLILVADAGLGTINGVRLAVAAIAAARGRTGPDWPVHLVVHLNRYDPGDDLHRRNRRWLADDGLTLTTTTDELTRAISGP